MKLLRIVILAFLMSLCLSGMANITSQTNRVGPYTISALPATLSVTFPYQSSSELLVLNLGANGTELDPAETLTLNSDYTVTGGGYNSTTNMQSGNVVVVSGGAHSVAVGDYIVILRNVPVNQATSLTSGVLTAAAVEKALDKQATLSQQLTEAVSRSLRFENGEVLDGTLDRTARIGKYLGFDSTGAIAYLDGGSGGGGTTYTAGTGLTLASNEFAVSPTQSFTSLTVTNPITGSVTGNAGTATALATARTINGTNFDGTINITVPAAAGTLTGATLASGVTASSLTSVGAGAIGTMVVQNANAVNITGGSIDGATVTGLPAPSAGSDAANKDYVDSISAGIVPRSAVVAATTANITLSAPQTIDGQAVIAGNRVLVKNQTLPEENGIYDVAAGAWTRSSDSNTAAELLFGYYYFVSTGTVNGATSWFIQTAPTTLGVDPVAFAQFSASQNYTAGTGLGLVGSQFSLNSALTGLTITGSAFNGTVGATTPSTISGTTLTLTTPAPVTSGGTGRNTGTTAYGLIAAGTTATGAQQTLAAGATTELLVGGGASALPVWTTATGSGAPVRATSPTLVSPALGTPASGVVTNLTGTASININGTVGATTPNTGAFTTLSATGLLSTAAGFQFRAADNTVYELLRYVGGANNPGLFAKVVESTGEVSLDASGAVGSWFLTIKNAGNEVGRFSSTGLAVTGGLSATTGINSTNIGATTPGTGAFTTLSASSTVSGAGFSSYLASPPAIGGTAAAAGSFTTLNASSTATLAGGVAVNSTGTNNAAIAFNNTGGGFGGFTWNAGGLAATGKFRIAGVSDWLTLDYNTGATTLPNLAGTGTRLVTADTNGVLGASTGSAVPTGGAKYARLAKNSTTNGDTGWYASTTFNVRDYGAGSGSAATDTAAINSAIADLNSAGRGTLYFPQSTTNYLVNSALTSITAAAAVKGDGIGASVISFAGVSGFTFDYSGSGSVKNAQVSGMKIITSSNSGSDIAIRYIPTSSSTALDPSFNFFDLLIGDGGTAWSQGIYINSPSLNHVQSGYIHEVSIYGSSSNVASMDKAIHIDNATGILMSNITINYANYGLHIEGDSEGNVLRGYAMVPVNYAVYVTGGTTAGANSFYAGECGAYTTGITIGASASSNECVVQDFYLLNLGSTSAIAVDLVNTSNTRVRSVLSQSTGNRFGYGIRVRNSSNSNSITECQIRNVANAAVDLGASTSYNRIFGIEFNDVIGASAIADAGSNNKTHGCFGLGSNTDTSWDTNPY